MKTQDSNHKDASAVPGDAGAGSKNRAGTPPTAAEIQAWLISYLARELDIDSRKIDIKTSFENYGLSSASAVFMTSDLSDWLGSEVDPTLPYDYSTIEKLARHLGETQNKTPGAR